MRSGSLKHLQELLQSADYGSIWSQAMSNGSESTQTSLSQGTNSCRQHRPSSMSSHAASSRKSAQNASQHVQRSHTAASERFGCTSAVEGHARAAAGISSARTSQDAEVLSTPMSSSDADDQVRDPNSGGHWHSARHTADDISRLQMLLDHSCNVANNCNQLQLEAPAIPRSTAASWPHSKTGASLPRLPQGNAGNMYTHSPEGMFSALVHVSHVASASLMTMHKICLSLHICCLSRNIVQSLA